MSMDKGYIVSKTTGYSAVPSADYDDAPPAAPYGSYRGGAAAPVRRNTFFSPAGDAQSSATVLVGTGTFFGRPTHVSAPSARGGLPFF